MKPEVGVPESEKFIGTLGMRLHVEHRSGAPRPYTIWSKAGAQEALYLARRHAARVQDHDLVVKADGALAIKRRAIGKELFDNLLHRRD